MKKFIKLLSTTILIVLLVSSCGKKDNTLEQQISKLQSENEKLMAANESLQAQVDLLSSESTSKSANSSETANNSLSVEPENTTGDYSVSDNADFVVNNTPINLSELALSFKDLSYDDIEVSHNVNEGDKLLELGQWKQNPGIENGNNYGDLKACVSNIIVGDKALSLQKSAEGFADYDITNSTIVCIEIALALGNEFSLESDSLIPYINFEAVNYNGNNESKKTKNFETTCGKWGIKLTSPEVGKVGYELLFVDIPSETQEFDLLFGSECLRHEKPYDCAYYHINLNNYR